MFSSIGHVVEVAESFEPNLVRGAVCSLLAAEQMHRDGFRVALCGEGADECPPDTLDSRGPSWKVIPTGGRFGTNASR